MNQGSPTSGSIPSSRLKDLLEVCLRFDFSRKAATRPLREALASLTVLAMIYALSQAAYTLLILFPKAEIAVRNLPTIVIDNGFVAIPDEEPQTILEDPRRHLLLFVAPRGEFTVSSVEYDLAAGLDRKNFLLRDARGQWWAFPLPHTLRMTIERDTIWAFLESWRPVLVVGIGLAMLAWFCFSRIVLALALAGIVSVFGAKFSPSYKITLYALGPATFFGLTLQWLNAFLVVPPLWIGYAIIPYLAITFVYLIGGLFMLREQGSNTKLH